MARGFLDLPAELRIHIYELIFKPEATFQVRKYLSNRMVRTMTRAGKNAGLDAWDGYWKPGVANGVSAFMATCHQIYSECYTVLYANTTFHCARISDFSEFLRSLGSKHRGLVATIEIASHNYEVLPKLKDLTGLKTLVVSVGYPAVWPPGFYGYQRANNWRWVRRPQTIEALKRFAETHRSLERIKFVERDWPDCYEYHAAANIEQVVSEIDEHIRDLRSS